MDFEKYIRKSNQENNIKDPSDVYSIEEIKEQQSIITNQIKTTIKYIGFLSALLVLILGISKFTSKTSTRNPFKTKNIAENNDQHFEENEIKEKANTLKVDDIEWDSLKTLSPNNEILKNSVENVAAGNDGKIFFISQGEEMSHVNLFDLNNNTKKILFKSPKVHSLAVSKEKDILSFISTSTSNNKKESLFLMNAKAEDPLEFEIDVEDVSINSYLITNNTLFFIDKNFPTLFSMNMKDNSIKEIDVFDRNVIPKIVGIDGDEIFINSNKESFKYNIKDNNMTEEFPGENTVYYNKINGDTLHITYDVSVKDGYIFELKKNDKVLYNNPATNCIINNNYIYVINDNYLEIFDINKGRLIFKKNMDFDLTDTNMTLIENVLFISDSNGLNYNVIDL